MYIRGNSSDNSNKSHTDLSEIDVQKFINNKFFLIENIYWHAEVKTYVCV